MKRIYKIAAMIFFLAILSKDLIGSLLFEAKATYFWPTAQYFREAYGQSGNQFQWFNYGGEISVSVWKGLGFWLGGHYFKKDGALTVTGDPIQLEFFPLYGGVHYRFENRRFQPYIGLGLAYFQANETATKGSIKSKSLGFIGNFGVVYKVLGPLILDIKGSYTYGRAKPGVLEADLGGFYGGLGIGLIF